MEKHKNTSKYKKNSLLLGTLFEQIKKLSQSNLSYWSKFISVQKYFRRWFSFWKTRQFVRSP